MVQGGIDTINARHGWDGENSLHDIATCRGADEAGTDIVSLQGTDVASYTAVSIDAYVHILQFTGPSYA